MENVISHETLCVAVGFLEHATLANNCRLLMIPDFLMDYSRVDGFNFIYIHFPVVFLQFQLFVLHYNQSSVKCVFNILSVDNLLNKKVNFEYTIT